MARSTTRLPTLTLLRVTAAMLRLNALAHSAVYVRLLIRIIVEDAPSPWHPFISARSVRWRTVLAWLCA